MGDVGVPRLVTWAECRKVASAYIRIYARKKRWSEEGYVRMSGMGL